VTIIPQIISVIIDRAERPASLYLSGPGLTIGSMSSAGPVRVILIGLAFSVCLPLVACGGDPSMPMIDGATGGDAATGGSSAGTGGTTGGTGGTHTTGGAVTLTGGSATGGAAATGGVKATGGSSTGGASTGGSSAGTGGAGGMCSGIIPFRGTSGSPGAGNTVGACLNIDGSGWMRIRFKADGTMCAPCTTNGAAVVGCSVVAADPRSRANIAETPAVTVSCVSACTECPVVKCYSTGGDFGTEYPCDLT
jgi:hypothetical protein